MPWLSSIERLALREGMEKGREEGIQEGIELDLEAKFGRQGRKLLAKVRALPNVAALRKFARFLKTATTLEQVRNYLK